MARTKKPRRPAPPLPPPSGLLRLLGVPASGTCSLSSMATTPVDWPAVTERLAGHPDEAAMPLARRYSPDVEITDVSSCAKAFPLAVALGNTHPQSPMPLSALEAFVAAFPTVATDPLSGVLALRAAGAPVRPELLAALRERNPYLCGEGPSETFRLMRWPASQGGRGGVPVDWAAVERRLRAYPREAGIPDRPSGRLPLEAALRVDRPPVPLSTVRLLLELGQAAATDPASSCALSCACARRGCEAARAVLRANPDQAGAICAYGEDSRYEEQVGYPLHAAAYFLKETGAELVAELVAACPAAVGSRDSIYDETPLEVACREAYSRRLSTDLLRVLLEAGHRRLLHGDGEAPPPLELERGQMLFSNGCSGETPLSELEHAFYWTRFSCDDETARSWDDCNLDRQPEVVHPGLPVIRMRHDWDNYCLGLQACGAHAARLPAERMWEYPLLQAALLFASRLNTVARVVRDHCAPVDLVALGPCGRTPLHAAIDRVIDGAGGGENHDDDEFPAVAALALLMDGDRAPPLADPADDGGLRLHRALRRGLGLDEGTRRIADAFPRALAVPDPCSGLVPCLLAAVGEGARVGTIFEMMVRRPDLVATLCVGDRQVH